MVKITIFNEMTNKKNQFMKTHKIAVSFKLNNADYPPLLIFLLKVLM